MENVEQAMGLVQLQFIWVSTDRTLYKYANAPTTFPVGKVLKKHLNKMAKHDNYFAIVTLTKKAKSKSEFSYDVLGVLNSFADLEETQKSNLIYWDYIKDSQSPDQKAERALDMAVHIFDHLHKNERESSDYNITTFDLLEMCVEGDIKQAKKISKELI